MRQGADKDLQLIPITFTSAASTVAIPANTVTQRDCGFIRGISIVAGEGSSDTTIEATSLSKDFKVNDDYILPAELPARVLLTKADTDPNCRAFNINRCIEPTGARISGELTTTATITTDETVYIVLWLERYAPEDANCSPCQNA